MIPRAQLFAVGPWARLLLLVPEPIRRQLRIGRSVIWSVVGVTALLPTTSSRAVTALARPVGVPALDSLHSGVGMATVFAVLLQHSFALGQLSRHGKLVARQPVLFKGRVRPLLAQLFALHTGRPPRPGSGRASGVGVQLPVPVLAARPKPEPLPGKLIQDRQLHGRLVLERE